MFKQRILRAAGAAPVAIGAILPRVIRAHKAAVRAGSIFEIAGFRCVAATALAGVGAVAIGVSPAMQTELAKILPGPIDKAAAGAAAGAGEFAGLGDLGEAVFIERYSIYSEIGSDDLVAADIDDHLRSLGHIHAIIRTDRHGGRNAGEFNLFP